MVTRIWLSACYEAKKRVKDYLIGGSVAPADEEVDEEREPKVQSNASITFVDEAGPSGACGGKRMADELVDMPRHNMNSFRIVEEHGERERYETSNSKRRCLEGYANVNTLPVVDVEHERNMMQLTALINRRNKSDELSVVETESTIDCHCLRTRRNLQIQTKGLDGVSRRICDNIQ